MKIISTIKNFIKSIFSHNIPSNLDLLKIHFSYISDTINIILFLGNKTKTKCDVSKYNLNEIKELMLKIKEINNINNIKINSPIIINEQPLIKIIKIIIKYE